MVAGSFDIIHLGHINYFKMAKQLCDDCKLIVVVARDSTIKRLKGRLPIFSEKERVEIVKSIKYVDDAVLGNEIGDKSFFDIIMDIKPEIIALGYNQNVDEEKLRKWLNEKKLDIKIVRLPKFEVLGGINSSSQARNKIIEVYKNSQEPSISKSKI